MMTRMKMLMVVAVVVMMAVAVTMIILMTENGDYTTTLRMRKTTAMITYGL